MFRTMKDWFAQVWSAAEGAEAETRVRVDHAAWDDARTFEPLCADRRSFRERHRSMSGRLKILVGWDDEPVDEDG